MFKWLILSAFVLGAGLIALAFSQFAVIGSSDLPEMTNPRIIITKSERKLELFDGDKSIKVYKIALGFTPEGDKEVEGDGKTPEGEFFVFTKNAQSSFYLSLGLSYPNIEDASRGLEKELISKKEHDDIVAAIREKRMPPQKTALGGEIYIHGHGNLTDWTAGCVAMTNSDIKELFDALPVGTPVTVIAAPLDENASGSDTGN